MRIVGVNYIFEGDGPPPNPAPKQPWEIVMELTKKIANLLSLIVARKPEWAEQIDSSIPVDQEDGLSIRNVMKTLVILDLRENVSYRTSRFSFSYDAATTYGLGFNGETAVSVDGLGDIESTVDGLVTAINGDATLSEIVDADREGEGNSSVLICRGFEQADYTIESSATGGTGTIGMLADSTTATAKIFLWAEGNGAVPGGWRKPKDGFFEEIDYTGFTERLDTAGFGRIAIEVVADGEFRAYVGPSKME